MKTYRETQSLNVKLVLAIISIACMVIAFGAYQQYLKGSSIGNVPENSTSLVLTFLLLIGLGVMLVRARLYTTINEEGIYVRLWPLQLQWRHTTWSEIDKLDVVQFDAIGEYGGYGIRFGLSGKGVAYIVEGNSGLHIHRKHKRSLLIGTQQSAEMLSQIEEWRKRLKKGK